MSCALAYWAAGMSIFDAISHSFATVAIGGAKNAGLLAISMLSITNLPIQKKLENYRHIMNKEVEANSKIQ